MPSDLVSSSERRSSRGMATAVPFPASLARRDTDGDGAGDGEEVCYGTDPLDYYG